ncbi:MAG: DHHA1 domain-containing protein [Desulfurococcales archaeon]|nr:DHHA1 domain-containing protein [Desulfurococcales archaeon]
MRYYIFTHTDLDGAGSAAAYLVAKGLQPNNPSVTIVYVEPYNINSFIEEYVAYLEKGDTIAIMDIGVNPAIYNDLKDKLRKAFSKGVKIEWYDHHIWDEKWIKEIKEIGVTLHLDTSTCATGVVARYSTRLNSSDDSAHYLTTLEKAVCAADLWRWDHHLAPKLFRIVTLNGNNGDKRRNMVVNKLATGILWDEELESILVEYVNEELKNYNKIDKGLVVVCREDCCIGLVMKERGPPTNSFVGSYMLSRFNIKVAVIAKSNGSISLRSREVDVQKIALNMGGGGHPRAAGAKPHLGFLEKILLRINKKLFLRLLGRKIVSIAVREDLCRVRQ